MAKTIYLIPTPLSDSARDGMLVPMTETVISATTYYYVENLRTARRFISSLKLGISIDSLSLFELSKDTQDLEIKKMLLEIPDKITQIAIMSEAGCPGIADPGGKMVAIAQSKGWKIIPLPGPSSLLLALMGSGFNGQQFSFRGYLPIKQEERLTAIRKLEEDCLKNGMTQLFIETPYRNIPLLRDLLVTLRPETLLCIAANLTSQDEILGTKKVKDWKNNIPEIHKIPTIFLLGT